MPKFGELKRTKKDGEDLEKEEHISVSAGPIERVIDYVFNPSRDKIREVTVIDRLQGRLFPQLDMISMGRRYILEIAIYRQNKEIYKEAFKRDRPIPPDLIDELQYRTAQWAKSIAGKNMERGIDLALAETEAKMGEDDMGKFSEDAFKD